VGPPPGQERTSENPTSNPTGPQSQPDRGR
jgi:hypothetical protein